MKSFTIFSSDLGGRNLKLHLGVFKNRGIPKWMVKIMENPIKMDDVGGKPTIFGNIQLPHLHPKSGRLNGFQLDKKQVCRAN